MHPEHPSSIVPIARGHEIRKNKRLEEVLSKMRRELDIQYIERLSLDLKETKVKSDQLVAQAWGALEQLEDFIAQLSEVDSESDDLIRLRKLKTRLGEEILLYREWFK